MRGKAEEIPVEKQLSWHQKLRRERQLRSWSQADVAEEIGSETKTVNRWESGKTFPSSYFRQKLVELFGKSAEELGLLSEQGSTDADALTEQTLRQVDWGEAPSIESFFGREKELTEIEQWIIGNNCRMIVILGIGGIGKTTLATMTAKKVKDAFDSVFWRSLHNAPPVESILEQCLHSLSPQQRVDLPKDLDGQIALLITALRQQHCLLLLDNVEAVLQAGQRVGHYLPGYEGYGRLLQRVGEANHQSCLLLTSREKPREVARMEGKTSAVRSFSLAGVTPVDGQRLLQDKDLLGSNEAWAMLVQLYSGNPLALKLVSEPIRDLFGGNIAGFLKEEEIVFGDIHDLLDQQFDRLSDLERDVIYWLAIERKGTSLNELRQNMMKGALLEVLDSLRRRSMIENSGDSRFTLQPAIMEYVTKRLVEQAYQEIDVETTELFGSHALIRAQANDYVRNSQIRLILTPLAARLLNTFGKAGSEKKLKSILSRLRMMHAQKYRYVAGNVLNLLVQLQVDLRGADLSDLTVEQAYLRGVALPKVNFAHSDLATSVFTDTFSTILCVALSANGTLLAAGTTTGEVRLWQADDATPLFTCPGHRDGIRCVAFSPDGKMLASGSEDQTLRLWDTGTGRCLKVLQGHTHWILSVAFSPDGKMLASGSEDQTVRFWDTSTGDCFKTLHGHTNWVRSVAFSPDGNVLASGSEDQTVRLWDTSTGDCLRTLQGHTNWVRYVAFSPVGGMLASGSEDQTVRIWDTASGDCFKVLPDHTSRVRAVVFSSDGNMLASCSDDQTIRLWNVNLGRCLKVLQGHTSRIWSVAFVPPDSNVLVSTSDDDTMRFWEVRSGQCIRTLQGHTSLIKSIAFSPDGQVIVSGSEDQAVRLWKVGEGRCWAVLRGHTHRVRAVAFSPDGARIASGSEDENVRMWDASTGRCLKILQGHTHLVRSVAFSPDSRMLASCSYDQTVRLWDTDNGDCLKTLHGHSSVVWCVAFSPDGNVLASGGEDRTIRLWEVRSGQQLNTLLGHSHQIWCVAFSPDGNSIASGSDDHTIRLWDAETGDCLRTFHGHTDWVRSIAFSPYGHILVSGSHDQTVRLWDVSTGDCLKTLHGHESRVLSTAFSPHGNVVASGGDDGTIRLWDIATGECVKVLRDEQLYEGMNIACVKGLTEGQKATLKVLGAVEDHRS
jgi:WD40 repeat protein/transcriptional regulator with XRE-family HTH domain